MFPSFPWFAVGFFFVWFVLFLSPSLHRHRGIRFWLHALQKKKKKEVKNNREEAVHIFLLYLSVERDVDAKNKKKVRFLVEYRFRLGIWVCEGKTKKKEEKKDQRCFNMADSALKQENEVVFYSSDMDNPQSFRIHVDTYTQTQTTEDHRHSNSNDRKHTKLREKKMEEMRQKKKELSEFCIQNSFIQSSSCPTKN